LEEQIGVLEHHGNRLEGLPVRLETVPLALELLAGSLEHHGDRLEELLM